MKKCVALLLLLAVFLSPAAARVQFRLGMETEAQVFTDSITVDHVSSSFSGTQDLLIGGFGELILNKLGIGFTGGVLLSDSQNTPDTPLYVQWNGSLYASHHFFGAGAFIDPYFGFGFGSAGSVLEEFKSYYGKEHWGQFSTGSMYTTSVALALYPYVKAGAALDLGGIIIGGEVGYNPVSLKVPGVTHFQLAPFRVKLSGAIGFGGRR